MTGSERFDRALEFFRVAIKLAPAERREFLAETRARDGSIADEVESLIAAAASFPDSLETDSHATSTGWPALPPESQIGAYRVISFIGAGGMGQVYLARDSALQRNVALKVLPAAAAKPERKSRFRGEAQALAALRHPHVAVIYGWEEVGDTLAIAMELVEGPTLADRIAKGGLEPHEALTIARQIAEALEAAHEQGIVHRDLKPSNVKITSEAGVKVLDFGLAKALTSSGTAAEVTTPLPDTQAGAILGTPPYMAPEQASGLAVDKRADIFAFGAVLFEMLVGRRVFAGTTTADVIASVIQCEPDFTAVPPHLRTVVSRCLSKDPRRRWGSMGDVLWALERATETRETSTRARRLWQMSAAAGCIALLAGAMVWFRTAKDDSTPLEFEIPAPPGTTFGPVGLGQLALSPDGRRLAFIATGADGVKRLWVRSLDSGTAFPLAGAEHVSLYSFWSPDSRWIAFSSNGRLQKTDVISGGAPQLICQCESVYGTWNAAGTIIFGALARPIQRVSAGGGTPADVFGFDAIRRETRQGAPDFLPDGKRFLYASFGNDTANTPGSPDGPHFSAMLGSLDGATRKYLFANPESPAFFGVNPAGGGALLYVTNGQLFARAFDPGRSEFVGEAQLIADAVGDGPVWSTSRNGLLAFRHTLPKRAQFGWFDSDGVQLETFRDLGNVSRPRISPDQKMIAFVRKEERSSDIWLLNVRSQATSRLTSDGGDDDFPVWSFDGNQITYSSRRNADRVITERAVNSIGPEVLVSKRPTVDSKYYGVPLLSLLPTSASPDGRWIAATETFGANAKVWLLAKDPKREPVNFVDGSDASVSPDGRWIVYASGGGRPEVFVRPMPPDAGGSPGSAGTWQISNSGGGNPVWRRDGKEIFYLAADGKLMSVPIESGEGFFRPKTPRALFQTPQLPSLFREYDVSRDGKRFLLTLPGVVDASQPITVIVNWPKLLKK